jgi:hypothetical protein
MAAESNIDELPEANLESGGKTAKPAPKKPAPAPKPDEPTTGNGVDNAAE